MNIPIHGGFHARMAEKFLQYLGLDTALNGTGSVSVAQSMRTEPLDLVRYGVVGVGVVEGMASHQPFEGQPPSLDTAILTDGFVGVSGTRGTKPTHGRKCGRNKPLIKADHCEHYFFHLSRSPAFFARDR